MMCVTLFVHDKSMATSQPTEIISVTNLKTRSTYQKAKSDAFQLKKMHLTGKFKGQNGKKNRPAKK